jgi:ABC-type transporter Mla MlaB component
LSQKIITVDCAGVTRLAATGLKALQDLQNQLAASGIRMLQQSLPPVDLLA